MNLWRPLSPQENLEFKQWARDHFNPKTDEIDDLWHPVVREECNKMIAESKQPRPLSVIAREIRLHWPNPYFGAKPYIEAMRGLNSITDTYGLDPASHIVMYFLSNATTWRGPKAREIKAELKAMLK